MFASRARDVRAHGAINKNIHVEDIDDENSLLFYEE